jgi:transcriptional regulator MraZ
MLSPTRGETVFRGQFSHTVDPKGRVSIPADFREVLADGFGDKLMLAPNGNSLDVYPERTWKELEGKVSGLPLLDPDRRKFQYLYLSGGKMVMLDPQGRIQIPQNYRERAALVKEVEIVSMMTYFEIWDKERWAHFQRDNAGPLDDLRERLASKGV